MTQNKQRQYLFRGKRKNGEWIFGYLATDNTINIPTNPRGYLELEVDPNTVGQYTGLDDKNGKKIFEGDIVRIYLTKKNYNEAIFHWDHSKPRHDYDGQYSNLNGYVKMPSWSYKSITRGKSYSMYDDNSEIIGNLHDNPELLND